MAAGYFDSPGAAALAGWNPTPKAAALSATAGSGIAWRPQPSDNALMMAIRDGGVAASCWSVSRAERGFPCRWTSVAISGR